MTTPPTDPRPDTLAAAKSLEGSMDDLAAAINDLRTYGHRNRTMIWGTIIAGIVVLGLVAWLALVTVQTRHAVAAAQRNADIQRATCETGNQTRAAQVQLWDLVLELSSEGRPNPTPAERQRTDQFRAFINRTFAPRDCAALIPGR